MSDKKIWGGLLLIDPTGQKQMVYYVATAWALLGGGLVLITTVGHWLRERRRDQAGQAEEQPQVQAEQAGKTPGEHPEPAEQQAGEQA